MSMRISELARGSGHSVATVKYYLREGLLPPGTPTAATQADYGPVHLERLRLIRALVDVARLPLATVRTVIAVLSDDTEDPATAVTLVHESLPPGPPADPAHPTTALAAIASLGWDVDPGSAAVLQLDAALRAVDDVGLEPDDAILHRYADAALDIARGEIGEMPVAGTAEALRYLVLGTVLYEPVLLALRRLAQQHAYAEVSRPNPGRRRRRR